MTYKSIKEITVMQIVPYTESCLRVYLERTEFAPFRKGHLYNVCPEFKAKLKEFFKMRTRCSGYTKRKY